MDYRNIGEALSAFDAQRYDIFRQIDERTFKALKYKTPKSKDKYGHAFDVFRCLDLRGACAVKSVTHNHEFHEYTRYDLGEDFYVEAYNNEITANREFWLGREFMDKKHLITSYDFGDTDYLGLFDDKGKLIIDQHIAEKTCRRHPNGNQNLIPQAEGICRRGSSRTNGPCDRLCAGNARRTVPQ